MRAGGRAGRCSPLHMQPMPDVSSLLVAWWKGRAPHPLHAALAHQRLGRPLKAPRSAPAPASARHAPFPPRHVLPHADSPPHQHCRRCLHGHTGCQLCRRCLHGLTGCLHRRRCLLGYTGCPRVRPLPRPQAPPLTAAGTALSTCRARSCGAATPRSSRRQWRGCWRGCCRRRWGGPAPLMWPLSGFQARGIASERAEACWELGVLLMLAAQPQRAACSQAGGWLTGAAHGSAVAVRQLPQAQAAHIPARPPGAQLAAAGWVHGAAEQPPPPPHPTPPPPRPCPTYTHAPTHPPTHPPCSASTAQAPERFRRWFPLNKRNAEFNAFITVLGFAWLVGPSKLKEVRCGCVPSRGCLDGGGTLCWVQVQAPKRKAWGSAPLGLAQAARLPRLEPKPGVWLVQRGAGSHIVLCCTLLPCACPPHLPFAFARRWRWSLRGARRSG